MINLRRSITLAVAFAAAVTLSACAGDGDAGADSAGMMGDTGAMGGMEGMGGMGGAAGMMADMRSHMRLMDGAGADSMKSMLPMHRQMAANMLATMNREMMSMNMPGDATWNATVDSIRRDLAGMPDLSDAQLQAFMPAHQARMTRLMEQHQRMMKDMPM